MREWAQEHGKAVRQLTITQTNTKHAARTLPLYMYRKELPVREKIATHNDEQQSEYHSASDEEDLQAEEIASAVGSDVFETTQTPVNVLS